MAGRGSSDRAPTAVTQRGGVYLLALFILASLELFTLG
jgi:hypothetical protein